MALFEEKASTQYGDYKGQISLDGHEGRFLHDLCEKKGVDPKYFPIGAQLYASQLIQEAMKDEVHLTIYAVDQNETGSGFDEITKFIKTNGGKVSTTKISLTLSFSELSEYIKRLGIIVLQNGFEDIVSHIIEDSE